MLREAGFSPRSHVMGCCNLVGYPGDTFAKAKATEAAAIQAGFIPYAMLYRDEKGEIQQQWQHFQREWLRPAIVGKKFGEIWNEEKRMRNEPVSRSLRAMRRQAEREQRAEKQRQAAAILATRDLEEQGSGCWQRPSADSEKEARNQAVEYCFHSIYAAVLLAAQEVYGFGHKRAWRLLKRADEIICTTLDSEEIVREVYSERMGLEINFREGIDRIREVGGSVSMEPWKPLSFKGI